MLKNVLHNYYVIFNYFIFIFVALTPTHFEIKMIFYLIVDIMYICNTKVQLDWSCIKFSHANKLIKKYIILNLIGRFTIIRLKLN